MIYSHFLPAKLKQKEHTEYYMQNNIFKEGKNCGIDMKVVSAFMIMRARFKYTEMRK